MIKIKRVISHQELAEFIQFYYDLYRGNDNAVPYLYADEKNTLRRDKNPSFECCEAEYFLAQKDGKTVGRVAAIINHRANERWNRRQVRFGWFDFIDDPEVSSALLKAVEDWGRQKGMTEIAGPLGFIDTDREGMLVEGFDDNWFDTKGEFLSLQAAAPVWKLLHHEDLAVLLRSPWPLQGCLWNPR